MASTKQSSIHRYRKNGIYKVCLIAKNNNGAGTLFMTLNVGTTSTFVDKEIINLQLFSNPCEDYFIVNFLNYFPERLKLILYNLEGQEVLSRRLFEGSNGIDIESISN